MKHRIILLVILGWCVNPLSIAAESNAEAFSKTPASKTPANNNIHPEVKAALDWVLPENPCQPPKQSIRHQATTTGGLEDGSFGNLGGGSNMGGGNVDYDTNTVERERIERKRKSYASCLKEYRQLLVVEFGRLKSVVRHGISEEQAVVILTKLSEIQRTIESPTGTLPENQVPEKEVPENELSDNTSADR